MRLRPHQEISREFLKRAPNRLLADEQRVGKTAAALMALRDIGEPPTLIVAPVSALYVWERDARLWGMPGRVAVNDPTADVCIVPWSMIASGALAAKLLARAWSTLVLDESHYAKNFTAARTRAAYGIYQHDLLHQHKALVHRAQRVWCLTGTPVPHDPSDLFPMMRALFPDTLRYRDGVWPDATREFDFLTRYVVRKPKQISPFRKIWVNIGGKNEIELRNRLGDNMLRRRQKDVGIFPPIPGTLPLPITATEAARINADPSMQAVLAAAREGMPMVDTHLAVIRHVTGDIKARAIVPLVKDYFEDTGDKLVLAYWHKTVGDHLENELSKFNPVRVDGATSYAQRGQLIDAFNNQPHCRLFLGQIEAAGQGIDLSAAPELWFVESVFSPRAMSQMSMRIANLNNTRQGIVRVSALRGSIDEAIQEALIRLFTTIEKILEA
jgi:hypothetical protein